MGLSLYKSLKDGISEEWKEICAPMQMYTKKEHMPLFTQDLTLSEIKGGLHYSPDF